MNAIASAATPKNELADGLKQGLLLGAAVLVLIVPPLRPLPPTLPVAVPAHAVPAAPRVADFHGTAATPPVRQVAQWVVDSRDNGNSPFVILDKHDARVYVFETSGRLMAASPVLLGYAPGDDTVPGIGTRSIADVKPEERTTPAGRFVSEPGRNALNEDVVWVDYDAAVSMHRVRATNPAEHRLERLATPTSADNRISYGCINLPVAFFENVVWPTLRAQRGIVYVLPEVKPLAAVFPGAAARLPAG